MNEESAKDIAEDDDYDGKSGGSPCINKPFETIELSWQVHSTFQLYH